MRAWVVFALSALVSGLVESATANGIEQQHEIDSAECTAIAMQVIPLPAVTVPNAITNTAPSSYSVSGSTTMYGQDGQAYTGYYNGTVSAGNTFDPMRALAAGAAFEQGLQDNAERSRANAVRRHLADACMLRRGWIKGGVRTAVKPSTRGTMTDHAQSAPSNDEKPQPYSAWLAERKN